MMSAATRWRSSNRLLGSVAANEPVVIWDHLGSEGRAAEHACAPPLTACVSICSTSRCRKPDSHARLTEYNFIVGLQSNTTGTSEDRNGSAPAHDLGSVFAAVIMQSEVTGERLVCDVRMLPRNGLVDVACSFGEHDVVRANEPVAMISDLRTPADVDAR